MDASTTDDPILLSLLCRLAPRDLAASRCVCAEWKGAIDSRRLLRADLLPLSVGGIFLSMSRLSYVEFFRPGSSAMSGNLAHLELDLSPYFEREFYGGTVEDHCNGLVLVESCLPYSCVANPATGWCAPLPPSPEQPKFYFHQTRCLVFDPAGAVSSSQLHYSVFIVNYAPLYNGYDGELQATDEWPPSTYLLHAFSSRTGRWEQRPFLRQGEAAGTIADVRLGKNREDCFAAYWKQALYVRCPNNFFLRISLSKDEYRVIKPPADMDISYSPLLGYVVVDFGKSEKGPCLAEIGYRGDPFYKVWILDESNHDSSEWVLKHCNKHLGTMLPRCYLDNKACGPWVLEDINSNEYNKTYADDPLMLILEGGTTATAAAAPKHPSADCGCEFDEEDFTLQTGGSSSTEVDRTSCCYINDFWVLGFHPYKENIVFFGSGTKRALAYDMNSSKFQYLGNIYPTHFDLYSPEESQGISKTFVYTPCKLDLEPYGHPAGSAHLLAEVD